MDIQLNYLETIFQQVPYDEILLEEGFPNHKMIDGPLFKSLAQPYITNRNAEEIQAMYHYMMAGKKLLPNLEHLSLIIDVSNQLLTFDGAKIQCKYLELLRWRKLSFSLGDDIFTTAFLAYHDYLHTPRSSSDSFYAWPPIISTDNSRLQAVLNQGLAENHNHLNGSTQIFPVSWVALMNHVTNRKQDFRNFEYRLHPKTDNRSKSKKTLEFHDQCLLAADIRVHLFKKIQGIFTDTKGSQGGSKRSQYQKILKLGTYLDVDDLQVEINSLKQFEGGATSFGNLDYALTKQILFKNNNNNRLLVGERYFLYQCFKHLLSGKFGYEELKFFYAYLLLKNNFRQELIQTNKLLGFANFKAYQDRKGDFVDGPKYKQYRHEQVRLALNSAMDDQAIISFETRIGPKEQGEKISDAIKAFEKAYYHADEQDFGIRKLSDKEGGTGWDNLAAVEDKMKKVEDSKHFYVLHFPKYGKKMMDEETYTEMADYSKCRDNEIRKRIKAQTNGILELLKSDSRERKLVKGIDTCSTEIDYRPELFAESFRKLRNHYQTTSEARLNGLDKEECCQQLRATNHSGEDFMDLLDGLRAIDETIKFCEFVRGDRLGHALALGLDAMEFYCLKEKTIISTKQDALDDLSWALYKSNLLGVTIHSTLRAKLKDDAMQLLVELYGPEVNLHDYQQAWLLRGDAPELYEKQKLNSDAKRHSLSDSEQYLTKAEFKKGKAANEVRDNMNYLKIYVNYHFDGQIKFKGREQYVRKITDEEIRWVTRLQNAMQKELMELGIAVECNPSSNYLISSFKRYEKHPIFRFNSTGLKDCDSPLSVSINTDDQGVFDTSLENEYALLAIALEKAKDGDGNRLYTPEAIYSWLDYVRKLGLQQSFK